MTIVGSLVFGDSIRTTGADASVAGYSFSMFGVGSLMVEDVTPTTSVGGLMARDATT